MHWWYITLIGAVDMHAPVNLVRDPASEQCQINLNVIIIRQIVATNMSMHCLSTLVMAKKTSL